MQHHRVVALLLCLSMAACTPMTPVHSDETAWLRATEKAQATLDDFLTKAKLLPAGTSAYALKVRIQQGRDTEYFWLNEFTWTDGAFTGRINDEPRLVKSVKAGEIVRFNRSQIVDWKYVDEKTGVTVGDFTSKAVP